MIQRMTAGNGTIRRVSVAVALSSVLAAVQGCGSDEGGGDDDTSQGATSGTANTGGADPGTGGTEPGTGGTEPGTGGTEPGTGGTAPVPTSGCNAMTWPDNGRYTIDVGGTTREYVFAAPDGYDASTPMKLIFVWHGLGGTLDMMENPYWGYFGMAQVNDGSAILAAGQGLPSADDPEGYAWWNTDGQDVAFVRALIEWFNSNFCIDTARIFSTGMSFGGIMSNTVGCELGDLVRAIGPIAGAGPGFGGFNTPTCVGQVASILIHGSADETVTLDMGEGSRDHWREANNCSTTSSPVDPTEYCVAYEGCDAGYPVHWCVHDGGHTIPDFSAPAIWDFFAQF